MTRTDAIGRWEVLRKDEKGYTFDSTVNGMLSNYEQMRYDRVMARLSEPWAPKSIEMVGH